MDLKDFKAGVETLSRFTNQRQAEPDPFMVQVGNDGQLSLISGNSLGIVAWRTGIKVNADRQRHGINSKTLTQAAKSLKGRGVTIDFGFSDRALEIDTNAGGSISLPFGEGPELRPIRHEGEPVLFIFTKDELDNFIAGISAASAESYPNALIVDRTTESTNLYRFGSTDRYKMYQEYKYAVSGVLEEPVAVPASVWNALRGSTTDAEARFYESSIKLSLGDIEFSTGILEDHPIWPDIHQKFFPRGYVADVMMQIDRKALIGSIKAVYPSVTAEAASIALIRDDQGKAYVQRISTGEAVGTQTTRGRGTGRCELSGRYLLDCLNAIPDNIVYVQWNNQSNYPVWVGGSLHPHSSFVIAPVVRV